MTADQKNTLRRAIVLTAQSGLKFCPSYVLHYGPHGGATLLEIFQQCEELYRQNVIDRATFTDGQPCYNAHNAPTL